MERSQSCRIRTYRVAPARLKDGSRWYDVPFFSQQLVCLAPEFEHEAAWKAEIFALLKHRHLGIVVSVSFRLSSNELHVALPHIALQQEQPRSALALMLP